MTENLTLETRESYVYHIKGLQLALTERNTRIKELEELLANPNPQIEKLERKAYKQGWRDCAAELMDITKDTVINLNKVNKHAWSVWLKIEGTE